MSAFDTEILPVEGQRVTLRRLLRTDLGDFQAYRQDPQVGLYQEWTPMSDAESLNFLSAMETAVFFKSGKWCQIGIADRITNKLIGDIGVCVVQGEEHAMIGITLRSPSQGQGLGKEALGLTLDLVFTNSKVLQVQAITDARNVPCIGLVESVGMQKEETVNAVFRGEPCLEHKYVLSRKIHARFTKE